MEWAFRNFETKKIISKGEAVEKAEVWLGENGTVPLVAGEDVKVVMPRAKRNQIKLTVKYPTPLLAPVEKGKEAGELVIEIPGQKPMTVGLLTGEADARKGVFGRVKDRLGYLISKEF